MTQTVKAAAAKAWWKSKTILFNAAAILAIALESTDVINAIPATYQDEAVALAAVINILLRFSTSKPVTK